MNLQRAKDGKIKICTNHSRVSAEDQEKKKDSPDLQKKQIEQYVNILGGVIPDYCWKYSGQEHATGIEERKKLNALLKDASKVFLMLSLSVMQADGQETTSSQKKVCRY